MSMVCLSMSNKTLTIQKIKQSYTMVEILLVIGLMAIMMGIGSAAISAIMTKRGVNGGVSIVSSQVNLARSVAVAKNHYIALLLPATGSHARFKDRFFKSMRLCYVKRTTDILGSGHNDVNYSASFAFSDWVEDHYWVDLPSKVCANFINGTDAADLKKRSYTRQTIQKVPNALGFDNCYGIIFAPTGALVSARTALIQVYPGITKADGSCVLLLKSENDLKYRRWCVEINRFTGRSRTTYAQVED